MDGVSNTNDLYITLHKRRTQITFSSLQKHLMWMLTGSRGPDKETFKSKIEIIFLPINIKMWFWVLKRNVSLSSKESSYVLLNIHNI